MPSLIEEDIGKECTNLDESQAELRKLELQASHIQHLIDHGSEDEIGGSNAHGDSDDEEDSDSDILDVDNLSGEESGEYDEKESDSIDAGVCRDFMYTSNYLQAPTTSYSPK